MESIKIEEDLTCKMITLQFLEKVLKNPVKSFKVTCGSNPGDNFCCILYAIEVKMKDLLEEPLYLLVKTIPNHPVRQKFLESSNLFSKELLVYQTLFPEYLKFQEEIGIRDNEILRPAVPPVLDGKAVDYREDKESCTNGSSMEESLNYLLMVDIRKTWGFKMADKQKGLDYNHCKLVIEELAKIHALSFSYKTYNGLKSLTERFPFLKETIFIENSSILEPMITNGFSMLKKMIEDERELERVERISKMAIKMFQAFLNPKGVDESFAKKLMKAEPIGIDLCSEESWIVGSHGDSWINNFLFKYAKEDTSGNAIPIQATLVDLQLARESCLTIDLVYFIYCSTDSTLRRKHLDDLLSVYHKSFIEYCTILKTVPFAGFTLEHLKARFHRSKAMGFVFAVMLLPIILQSPENAVDLDKVKINGNANNGNANNGERDSANLAEIIQSIRVNESDELLMKKRLLEIVRELVEDGIL